MTDLDHSPARPLSQKPGPRSPPPEPDRRRAYHGVDRKSAGKCVTSAEIVCATVKHVRDQRRRPRSGMARRARSTRRWVTGNTGRAETALPSAFGRFSRIDVVPATIAGPSTPAGPCPKGAVPIVSPMPCCLPDHRAHRLAVGKGVRGRTASRWVHRKALLVFEECLVDPHARRRQRREVPAWGVVVDYRAKERLLLRGAGVR